MTNEALLQMVSDARAKAAESPARKKLLSLFDEGTFTELDALAASDNSPAEVVTGYGYISGVYAYAFAQDSSVNAGAVGKLQADKIKKLYEISLKTGEPIVGIYDSNGAHIDEGFDVLAAYGELLEASANISGFVPQIAVVSGTCAGAAAMMAANADIVIMQEDAELFLTAPSVLGDESLGSAEVAAANGTAHIVAADFDAAAEAVRDCITSLPSNNLSVAPIADAAAPDVEKLNAVCSSMSISTDAFDIINNLFDTGSFVELGAGYGKSAVTGFARLNGISCGVIVNNGKETDGYIGNTASNKIARMVRLLDAFNLPIITIVNTLGFSTCAKAEKNGVLRTHAKLAHAYAEATTAKISLVVGQAYGPAYIALAGKGANSDMSFAWPSAQISALAPDTAVTVLYSERLDAGEQRADLLSEYHEKVSSPLIAAKNGYIDDVILPAETRAKLYSAVDVLLSKRVTRLAKKHSNMPL